MTWFPDLSPCDYFGSDAARCLRAVGWLERGRDHAKGEVGREEFDKLVGLLNDPWQPVVSVGVHACDICQHTPTESATSNLFVPGAGHTYAAPALITHYINVHWYKPPQEFLEAVMACSGTRTMEYKRALLQNGGGMLVKNAG